MIYLENAATTKPKFFRSNYEDFWMNSNTPYTRTEEQLVLENEKEKIKSCLGVKGGYVLFFRCATEAVEWLAHKFCVNEIYCSPYEHDSVFNISDRIMENETQIFFNREEYGLYCHQLVNQITGDTWDIKKAKEKFVTKSNQFFGVDLTAAIGHIVLPNDLEEYCDALWFSGHKFHTEKGIGAMWISDRLGNYLGASKDPKNQYNLVHGTIDVPGACMLADAMENTCACSDNLYPHYLIVTLLKELKRNNIECKLIANNDNIEYLTRPCKSFYINAIYLLGINADALQTYLSSKDIYIGTAHSACSGESDYRILEAMGYDKKIASQTIRVSFSVDNTVKDIQTLVEEIKKFKELF